MRQREFGTVLLYVGLAMLVVAVGRAWLWHSSVERPVLIGSVLVGLGFAVRRGLLAKSEAQS